MNRLKDSHDILINEKKLGTNMYTIISYKKKGKRKRKEQKKSEKKKGTSASTNIKT